MKGISNDIVFAEDLGSVRQHSGMHEAGEFRYGIVVSRYNEHLTHALLKAAVTCLKQHGASDEQIEVYWVPGAYEIPAVASRLGETMSCNAVIALGAVIEGQTSHADLITRTVAQTLTQLALEHGMPMIDSVVCTRTEEQAIARCQGNEGTRGWYAALAAMEMAQLFATMEAS